MSKMSMREAWRAVDARNQAKLAEEAEAILAEMNKGKTEEPINVESTVTEITEPTNSAEQIKLQNEAKRLQAELAELEKQEQTAMRQVAEMRADEIVNSDRMPANFKKMLIEDLLANPSRFENFYMKLPSRPPGAEPLDVVRRNSNQP
jgi:hypothetical protein